MGARDSPPLDQRPVPDLLGEHDTWENSPETETSGDADDNRRLDHRLYATTTTDFRHYTPTRLLYDPGFNVIDGTIVIWERVSAWS